MLIAVAEGEDNITMGSTIIDPDLPAQIRNPPVDRTLPQQILIRFSETMKEPFSEALETVKAINAAKDMVGLETFLELIKRCNSAEEFADNLSKAVTKQ